MSQLQWREEFRIGIDELDFEHQDMFATLKALHEQCAAKADPDAIEHCLGLLHARLEAHFALEEQVMRDRNNPRYVEHKAEHDRFLDEVGEFLAGFDRSQPREEVDALAERVNHWTAEHIMSFDRDLGRGTG